MAITHVAVGTASRTTGGASLLSVLPAGLLQNDVMLLWLAFAEGVTAITGLTGWTQVGTTQTDGLRGTYALFQKVAGAGETAPTVSWTTNTKCIFHNAAYRGCDTTTPVVAGSVALDVVSSLTIVGPTVNNTGTGVEWAAGFYAFETSSATDKTSAITPNAALTERADSNISAATSANYIIAEVSDSNAAVTAGNHSYNATSTASTAAAHKGAALAYLNPAAAGGPAFVRPTIIVSREAHRRSTRW